MRSWPFLRVVLGAEAERALVAAEALLDDPVEALEGAAADEEDVRGVDLDEVLVRVLAAALRRHVGHRALDDLEQRLLHALAGDVARDRRVVGLARDLVDLVDVDDAALGPLHVEVGGLDQVQEDVLDVLTDVAGLGQRRGVGDGERHVEDLRQRAGEVRLADAGRADEEDVALLQLDVAGGGAAVGVDALVVVVDGDGEDLLRLLLADDVLAELLEDLLRRRRALSGAGLGLRRARRFFVDDLAAELDALVADVDGAGAGDQALDLVLALAAERAVVLHARLPVVRHALRSPSGYGPALAPCSRPS